MNFEPQKFFIGLVDFFSILLPGAFVMYFYRQLPHDPLFTSSQKHDAEHWVVFVFFSYLVGHLLFLVSTLLDELLYDPLRSCTYWEQVKRLATGKNLRPKLFRGMADSKFFFFGKGADHAVKQVVRVKDFALKKAFPAAAINAYQWSKAVLSKELPEGLIAVQRFEADSKFFRSFSVALLTLAIYFFCRQHLAGFGLLISLIPFCLWRYIDLRYKATQQAYWYIITLESLKAEPLIGFDKDGKTHHVTHAGGVVFRKGVGNTEFLLIHSSKGDEWVLPKGHIEKGETKEQTAVREVKEETAHWARVLKPLKEVLINSTPASLVQYYLMEYLEPGQTSENRECLWMSVDEAMMKASFAETRELLKEANTIIEKLGQVRSKS